MGQTSNDHFDNTMDNGSIRADFAFVVGGWPTIYTVSSSDYTLAGDLANFDSIRAWANLPDLSSRKCKGRPEDGQVSFGSVSQGIMDVNEDGARALTDLAARFSYLLGESSGVETTANGAIGRTDTTITLTDASSLPSSGRIWISQECISYTGKSTNDLTGCTRGALLTASSPHEDGVKVYAYKPTLNMSPFFLYKGAVDLPMEHWLPAGGGVIMSDAKSGNLLVLTGMDTGWLFWKNAEAHIMNPWRTWSPEEVDPHLPPTTGELGDVLLGHDFNITVDTWGDLSRLGNGHYVINVGDETMVIQGVS